MRPRRRLPVALLLVLAALALSAMFVSSATALPTFDQAVGGIGPCETCHGGSFPAGVHAVAAHSSFIGTCTTCHTVNTATPPLPAACGACHGGVGVIVAAHVAAPAPAAGCATATGCHVAAITNINPASGPVGTTVTLTGTAFTGATGVTFNGVSALTFTVVSDTTLTVAVPVGASTGPVAVTGVRGTGTSVGSFTVTVPAKPAIVKLKPTAGKRLSKVVITGKAFGAKRGTSFVKFGTVKVKKYFSWSVGKVTVQVPAKARFGLVKVKLTTTVGTSNAKTFKVKR
jgi:hypothetical protein